MSKTILSIHSRIEARADLRAFRAQILASLIPAQIEKRAFDSRRTNQYTDYNPRRSVQYYHRSDAFITKPLAETIKTFFKLKTAADSIKEDFTGDPDWFDSYARILCASLDRTLRVDQQDGDFFQPQMDYVKELLYLRYRLREEDVEKLGEKDLRNIILDRDEKLLHKQIYAAYNNGGLMKKGNPAPDMIKTQDTLMEKLFGEVKATAENKEVSRSVTITINDKIVDGINKEG
jgi:hypothetical protein